MNKAVKIKRIANGICPICQKKSRRTLRFIKFPSKGQTEAQILKLLISQSQIALAQPVLHFSCEKNNR